MPIVKVCNEKYDTVQKTVNLINYVMNPEKRVNNIFGYGGLYIHNDVVNIARQFEDINTYYGKTSGSLVKHLIISYDYLDGQCSPQNMNKMLQNLFQLDLCGYSYLYALHEDTLHAHFHIIFCSTNLYTGRKYSDNREAIFGIAQTLSHYSSYIGNDGRMHNINYQVVYDTKKASGCE